MKLATTQRSGKLSADVVAPLIGICLALLTLFGIFWSFYRHGPGHGVASVLIPPYALYRGIAAIWDEPLWKERYNARTEQLALVIGKR